MLKPILDAQSRFSISWLIRLWIVAMVVAATCAGPAGAQNPPTATTTTIAASANPTTVGQPVTFTATVAGSGGTPTGTVTFKDGSATLGTGEVSADGSARLAISSLTSGSHSLTAAYGGDAAFANSQSAPLTLVVDKAATTITIASSANSATVGQSVTFTAAVEGPGGTPTGTVSFKEHADTLGTATLSADSSAKVAVSMPSAGSRTIIAAYGGDARFAGSTSVPLVQVVDKATTATVIASSPNPATVGQTITFTATVTATDGTPTGVVTFKDGPTTLGVGPLAGDGSMKLAVSTLTSGPHAITAAYGGDASFAPSISPAYGQTLDPASSGYQPVLILIATIAIAALLVLLRGAAIIVVRTLFRWLLLPIWRGVSWVFKRIGAGLRFLRILSRSKQRPAEAFLGLSVKTISRALTETDEAIAENFNAATVPIERHRRLICFWLRPNTQHAGEYEREQADKDFKKAEKFFLAEVPIKTNPLNLYDDVHNAFVVRLFKDSDKVCFHVLSEFRKTINSNVMTLSVIFSLIVSVVAVLNILWSRSVDFYKLAGVTQGRWLPAVISFLGMEFQTKVVVNTAIFGAVSCVLGFGLMWLFYNIAYDQSQRHNGQQMNNFLVRYLAEINIQFAKIHTRATQAVIEEDIDVVKKESVLWITNLQWMAFRVLFVEEFLRSVLFQARRNSIYALFLIPFFFICSMLVVAWVLNIQQFSVLDVESGVYQQNTFYVFFAWLVYIYYRYMTRSLLPMEESIDGQWSKFREMNVQGAMTKILESYANQLDQWRSRFRERGGPMG